MIWKPKAQAKVTKTETAHAVSLLSSAVWHMGIIEEFAHIRYIGAMHPNLSDSGSHHGVEVWTDIVEDQYGYQGVPMAEDLGTSSIDEIETVLSAVEATGKGFPRDEVYSVIMIESGWKPHNYYHSKLVPPEKAAGGLIGFMPFVLKSLGWDDTAIEFRKLSTAEQAPWVAEYFRRSAPWKYPGDTYVATAAGGYTGKSGATTVYKNDPNKQNDAWDLNKVWDINKDEVITVEELRQVLLTRMKKAPVGGEVIEPGPKAPPGGSPGEPSPALVYWLGVCTSPNASCLLSLHKGMYDSPLVKIVQTSLKKKGLYSGKLDGDFGPLTEAAMRAFVNLQSKTVEHL